MKKHTGLYTNFYSFFSRSFHAYGLATRFLRLMPAALLIFCQDAMAIDDDLIKTSYSYRRFNVHDGLPENPCYSLMQDKNGFIWVGTLNGFARYDGQDFKLFHNESDEGIVGLFENERRDVIAISHRNLYKVITEEDSLLRMKNVSDEVLIYSKGKSRYLPKGYAIYHNGQANNLYAITDSIPTKVFENKILDMMDINHALHWDVGNKRFFIPTYEGVYIVSEKGLVERKFDIDNIFSIISCHGRPLAVASDGLYEYKEGELVRILEYPFYMGIPLFMNILEGANHDLIIGTDNTVFRYTGGKVEIIAEDITQIYDMLIDKEGNLWVATVDGVYDFFGLSFKNYKLLPEGDIAMSVISDKQKKVWLTSLDGRLISLQDDKPYLIDYPQPPPEPDLSSDFISRFFNRGAELIGDNIYIPGSGDVLQYNMINRKFSWLGLPKSIYIFIKPLPDGDVMVGGESIVYVYRHGKGVIKQYSIEEIGQTPFCGVTDRQGRIFLGGPGGITIIGNDSIQVIKNDTLKLCRYMFCDKTGRIWMGCLNKLVVNNGDDMQFVHSFPNTLIRSLFITDNGIMIVSTIDAIYVSKNSDYTEFVRYDQYNGFNSLGPLSVSMTEDNEGYVWILTIKDAVRFRPDDLLFHRHVPILHLTHMQISDDNIQWNTMEEEQYRIKYKNRNVKFRYVGLCYSAAGNLRYQYRLIGFQDEWSKPAPEREITFNNLPPGEYEFQIKANAGNDDTETEIISKHFSIHPAFWQTTLFWVVCAALLMLSGAGIMLYFQRKKNKKLIERLEAEKQLNELKISSIRLKAIPHFNANVMAAIEYYIMNKSKEDAMSILGVYSRFMFETLQDVDKASRSLSEELAYVKMYLDLEKLRFIDKFDYEMEVSDNINTDKFQLPNMILHTWAENAIKHGLSSKTSGGRLIIKAVQSGDIINVSVEDNGVGREAAANNPHTRSSKKGLYILSQQIAIYNRLNRVKINQEIEDLFADGQPCGTRFSLEVPSSFIYVF